jgi:hypothetical protein
MMDELALSERLPPGAVGDEVVALLPRGRVLLDAETEAGVPAKGKPEGGGRRTNSCIR